MTIEEIPTAVQDFLDEDPAIRGQNYACISFVSPEDILSNKEVFFFQDFLKKFSKDLQQVATNLKDRFPECGSALDNLKESHSHLFDPDQLQEEFRMFKQTESERLDKEFHELNEYKTTIRGVKIRGVFDTVAEAKNRADLLKRKGDKFDIFIAQVGCWCPWSPNPHDIADQEYAEVQLNTFMKQYKENIAHRDEVYEKRKSERMSVASLAEQLNKVDPWTQK